MSEAGGGKLAEILAKKRAAREKAREEDPLSLSRNASTNVDQIESEDDDRRCVSHTTGSQDFTERSRIGGFVNMNLSQVEDLTRVAQGGLGILYQGTWRGTVVAVKKPVDPRVASDPALKEDFRREVEILSEIRHPNVVLLMGACLEGKGLCIVLEWCQGGSLYDVLHRRRVDMNTHQRVKIARGIACGIAFLHTASPAIIHRDLKSQNILLDETLTTPKLCDFGLAIRLSDSYTTNAQAGTPSYMAPELYRGEACSLASDVYAFGIVLCEIFSQELPFAALELSEIREKERDMGMRVERL